MDLVDLPKLENTNNLSIQELNDTESFRDLKETWNTLLQKSDDNNIFLTWEWLFNWWQIYSKGKKLRIILIKDGEKIIGIIPLMSVKYKQGFISIDTLENLCSEECDYSGIILSEKRGESIALVSKYMANIINDEKLVIRMHQIPENSAFLTSLRGQYPSLSKYLNFQEQKESSCARIVLPATWDQYFSSLSGKLRYKLRRKMKLLETEHKVELYKYDGSPDLNEKLQILFDLHQKEWGNESKFIQHEAREFYLNVSADCSRNRWLDLHILYADEKPASISWGFSYNNIFWGMTIAFNADYSGYGVGNLHFMKLIENCTNRGLKIFDFLKGDEHYKSRWKCSATDNFKITITDKSTAGKYRAKLLEMLIKYENARKRTFLENIKLLLKKTQPTKKPNNDQQTTDNKDEL